MHLSAQTLYSRYINPYVTQMKTMCVFHPGWWQLLQQFSKGGIQLGCSLHVCVCVWFVLRYGQKGSLSSHNSNVLTGLFHWLSPPPKKNTATSYKPPPPNGVAWASRYCFHPWLSTDPLTQPAISCIQEGNVSSQRPARWPGTSFTTLCQWVSCCVWSASDRCSTGE